MVRAVLTIVALIVLPVRLDAQTLDPQTVEDRIQAVRTRALAAGVPVSLLDAKIEEGRAKGVSMDRIATVLAHRAAVLERANATMRSVRQDISEADLIAGADALEAGVGEQLIAELTSAAPRDGRAVAITVLTGLVNMNVAPNEALDRVLDALTRGPGALASLPGQAGSRAIGDRVERGTGRPPSATGAATRRGAPEPSVPTVGPPDARPGAPARPGMQRSIAKI